MLLRIAAAVAAAIVVVVDDVDFFSLSIGRSAAVAVAEQAFDFFWWTFFSLVSLASNNSQFRWFDELRNVWLCSAYSNSDIEKRSIFTINVFGFF